MLDVLLVDDEPALLAAVADVLRLDSHSVTTANDGGQAVAALRGHCFDLVICDMRLPVLDGLGVFREVRARTPATDFVFITAFGAVPEAVEALKEGATDYLTKPFALATLRARVGQVDRARQLRRELSWAREKLADTGGTRAIGESVAFKQALDRLPSFAESGYPVLILGESGTGKELVTKMLHEHSQRRAQPLVTINCAALPESLLEAELFGYRRGAFTGAVGEREGRFRRANGGTLFLDEVAELAPTAQAKLLRVLQEGVLEPLGSDRSFRVDVRIVSATHRDLRAAVERGHFREDLYYRLKVLTIDMPPLRARLGDVLLLATHFLDQLHHPGGANNVDPAALSALCAYPFPGNVRELEHALQYACVLARGRTIERGHLPTEIANFAPTAGRRPAGAAAGESTLRPSVPRGDGLGVARGARPNTVVEPGSAPSDDGCAPAELPQRGQLLPLAAAVAAFERAYLIRALRATEGHRGAAAALLGISRKSLWQKLRRAAPKEGPP